MSNRVLIIAEAGVNHNGDIAIAKKLVDVAANAGVDYVKFQTFKAKNLVSEKAVKAAYQIDSSENKQETQYEMLTKLELSYDNHSELIAYCKTRNVKFLSTAFDLESIEFLKDKLDFYKIPSGEITNLPYLEKVAILGLSIVMSTGMANLQEVKDAFNVLIKNGVKKEDITILHCNTEYPTPMEDVNLTAMLSIEKELGVKIGYSDHTLGIEVSIAAVALGAKVIEKHFTLDCTMEGPDHKASLEPTELKAMVAAIRNIEKAMGNGVKKPSPSEMPNIPIARKSVFIKHSLPKGHILTAEDLVMKRPGDGISPMDIDSVIGETLIVDVSEETKLSMAMLK